VFLVVIDAVADEDEDDHGGEGRCHSDVVHLSQVEEEVSETLQ
jgi:hypothetical protein